MQNGCLGSRAGRLQRLISRRFEHALRSLGLTLSQMEILSALIIMGRPVKPAFVAEKLSVERSTMSRNLTLMETKGLVATAERSASGRSLTVTITDVGVTTLASARTTWQETQDALVTDLGASAPATLDAWLTGLSGSP